MTDDEIREIRRRFPSEAKLWTVCTRALHASCPGDRSMLEQAIRRELDAIESRSVEVER